MSWFSPPVKKKPAKVEPDKPKPMPIVRPDDPVILYGHDLSQWNFLGRTEISQTDSNYKSPIFFFCSKEDSNRRSIYHLDPYDTHKYHPYYTMGAKPWAAGEDEFFHYIHVPSDYLKEYMMKEFSCVWSLKKKWWISNDESKYENAQNEQKKQEDKHPSIVSKDEKIIQVDFQKK